LVHRPGATNAFEFVILSSLRAAQLMRGCTPRVDLHGKAVTIAQREVAEGKVSRLDVLPRVP
jgi:DNA-directed RNA polymerase subunit K/omega